MIKRKAKAFSLLELMLVTVLIGVVTAIALPGYRAYVERTKIGTAIGDITKLDIKIARFFARSAQFPESLNELGEIPLDPWGNTYRYLNIANANNIGLVRKDKNLVPINSDYDLYSMGADGESRPPLPAKPSHDDIIRANNGHFLGIAEEY